MQDMTTVRVGDARVTLLNAGDMRLVLSRELDVPEALWRPQYADLFERPGVFPVPGGPHKRILRGGWIPIDLKSCG